MSILYAKNSMRDFYLRVLHESSKWEYSTGSMVWLLNQSSYEVFSISIKIHWETSIGDFYTSIQNENTTHG